MNFLCFRILRLLPAEDHLSGGARAAHWQQTVVSDGSGVDAARGVVQMHLLLRQKHEHDIPAEDCA